MPDAPARQVEEHLRLDVQTAVARLERRLRLLARGDVAKAPDAAGDCRALYSFATVVDEVAFGITHVIRAEEHLSNTPAQILIFQALGATPPEFAHIPLVNYNNEKMSKRKLPPLSATEIGALKACGWTDDEIKGRDDLNIATVAYYRELGYLPAAVVASLDGLPTTDLAGLVAHLAGRFPIVTEDAPVEGRRVADEQDVRLLEALTAG